MPKALEIVFDGPPDHGPPRLVEVEDGAGKGVDVGAWVERDDGTWALQITPDDFQDVEDIEPVRDGPRVLLFEQTTHQEDWRVEAYDLDGDGDVNLCVFTGPRAEKLARQAAKLLESEIGKSK